MNKLFEILERGELPSFLEVMQAIDEGTQCGWDFSDAPVQSESEPYPQTVCELNGRCCCGD